MEDLRRAYGSLRTSPTTSRMATTTICGSRVVMCLASGDVASSGQPATPEDSLREGLGGTTLWYTIAISC